MREFITFLATMILIVGVGCIWHNEGYKDAMKRVNELPSAMDVYQGKTTLQYTIVDGVKVDSVVVFKNK